MRFLLINPFYPIDEGPSPPLGLGYLAATLENADIEVRIYDLAVYPYSKESLASVLEEFQPQFVGATAVTMSFDHAIQVIGDTKDINPEIITVMGGPHVSFCAEETLSLFPELDFVVLGEGEETILRLIDAWQGKQQYDQIEGLAYRNGTEIVSTGMKQPCFDVNSLPIPARHLIPLGRYRALNSSINMTTSRGCPFKCIFCVGRKMVGAKVRYRNAKSVVDEMALLAELGFHQINIADDLFTANKKHCIEICDEIMNRGLKVKWSSFARVDTVSPEVLKKMQAAGCTAVSFGLETANAEILKTIKKGITLPQILEAIEMCNDAGISPNGSFILGLPGETPETLKETIEFGEKIKKMGVLFGFHLLAPFPGTQVRDNCDDYGIKILTNNWSEYHANRAIVETPGVNKKMLDDIALEWEDEVTVWLGHIKEEMEKGTATEEFAYPLVNLIRTMTTYDLMMGNVLEQKGVWKTGNGSVSPDEALEQLVDRVHDSVSYSREDVHDALSHAYKKDNLRFRTERDTLTWEWVDFLENP